jgi:phage-related protein
MSLPIPTLPSNAGAYKLIGGSSAVTLPTLVSSTNEAVGVNSYAQDIPGLDGLFSYRKPTFAGRSLSLSGKIYDESTVTSLRRVLAAKRISVERDNRVLDAEVTDFSLVETVYGSVWTVNLELSGLKPWWEAKAASVVESISFSSPHSINVTNNGSAVVLPTFTVVGGSGGLASISFETDGRLVLWAGNLGYDEVLRIDCLNRTATIDYVNALSEVDEEFLVDPLRIDPGLHSIGVTFIGNYLSYSISWRDLFL